MSDTMLYLSPEGNDQNSGLTPLEPKATIEGVMAALRKIQPEEPVTVIVNGGYYHLTEPVILRPEDSFPVTFQAAENEQPVFTRAIKLKNWQSCQVNGLDVICADLTELLDADYELENFYVNRKRKKVATFPKNGEFYRPAKPDYEITNELFNGADHFRPATSDFNPEWEAPENICARIVYKWIDAVLPVKRYDEDSGNLYFTKIATFELDPEITEYRLENVREALLEPGEWYYDRKAQTIYYLPEDGQNIDNISAMVPGQGSLVRFEGDPKNKNYIEHINFAGLQFEFGGGGRPDVSLDYDFCNGKPSGIRNYSIRKKWQRKGLDYAKVASSPQAAVNIPGVIFLHGAKHCRFSNCTMAHSSWYGLEVANGCENITVEHCDFYDLGGGGIKIGGGNSATETPLELTSRCIITDNHISHCGLDHYAAVGIILLNAFGCLVEHNHIHDLYYSGISCGWEWGYGDSVSRENRIGFNHIHDLGKGVLSDMGGVYLLGIQPGTRVYNNLIHDVKCRYYGGWGLYTDEGSAHIVLEKNACLNCSCEGYHQHYGRENIVRFNVFAYGGEYGIAISVGTKQDKGYTWPGDNYARNMMFCNNVIVAKPGLPFFKTCKEGIDAEQFYSESNCLYSLSDNYGDFFYYQDKDAERTGTLEEWRQEKQHDLSSVIGEPGFVDMDNFDFALKPDALLRKINFPELDFSNVGVRTSNE
jgi:Right handed beta helix region